MRNARKRDYLPETRCCITGPSARITTIPIAPRTSRCLCRDGATRAVTIPSTRVMAIGTIIGTDITTTMTTAPTPTIITTITKASDAANRSLNKKTAAQAAVFLFPLHLLTEHLRTLNPAQAPSASR